MSDWDRIITSAPLNRDAAKARDGGGVDFTPAVPNEPQRARHLTPPKLRTPPDGLDLRGIRFGRFVVIGLVEREKNGQRGRWCVRCDCGAYEERKAKAIRNSINANDACVECRHTQKIASTEYQQRPMRRDLLRSAK